MLLQMESLNVSIVVLNGNNLTFSSGTTVKCQHLWWKYRIMIKLTPLAAFKHVVA